MLKCCTKAENKTGSSAQVVDNRLVLSLPDARTPTVWQMELGQARASALEVREEAVSKTAKSKDTGAGYTLIMKTPEGAEQVIATYEARETAVAILMAAGQALERGGSTRDKGACCPTSSVDHAHGKKGGEMGAYWLAALLGVVTLVILFILLSNTGITPYDPASGGSVAAISDPQNVTGVPVSADAFLREAP